MTHYRLGKVQAVIPMLLAAALSPYAYADIYKYIDKHGRVILTDRPQHSGFVRLVKTWKGWAEPKAKLNTAHYKQNQKKFMPLIAEAARRHQLPDSLLHAVITAESAYDPEAISRAGAMGLMQLMPETARRYGVINRKDPRANVYGGTRYLKDLLALFNNDVQLALAAYNAGENAVIRHGKKIPPYNETRNYVRQVLHYYKQYREKGIVVAEG
jgi:soluble lytic murein transglycosylase-like protein